MGLDRAGKCTRCARYYRAHLAGGTLRFPADPLQGIPKADESVLVTAYAARDAVSRGGHRALAAEGTVFGGASRPREIALSLDPSRKGAGRAPLQPTARAVRALDHDRCVGTGFEQKGDFGSPFANPSP